MAPSIGTRLLWVGVVLSIVIALYALSGVLRAMLFVGSSAETTYALNGVLRAKLFVGSSAETTMAVWGGVFAVSLVALAFCAARLWFVRAQMRVNQRFVERSVAAFLGAFYVFALGPLTMLAALLYLPAAQVAYVRGWVSKAALYVTVDLVTALCVAIPFGVLLGFTVRSSLLSSVIAFVGTVIAVSVLFVTVDSLRGTALTFPELRVLGLGEALSRLMFHRDFWLFPLAVVVVAFGVWRWRARRSGPIESAP